MESPLLAPIRMASALLFFPQFFQITHTVYSFFHFSYRNFLSSVLLHCFFQTYKHFLQVIFQLISQHPLRLLQYPPQSSSPCPQSAEAGNHIYYSQQYTVHEEGKVSVPERFLNKHRCHPSTPSSKNTIFLSLFFKI